MVESEETATDQIQIVHLLKHITHIYQDAERAVLLQYSFTGCYKSFYSVRPLSFNFTGFQSYISFNSSILLCICDTEVNTFLIK